MRKTDGVRRNELKLLLEVLTVRLVWCWAAVDCFVLWNESLLVDGGERSEGASDGMRGSLLELRVAGMARSVLSTSVGEMLQRGKTSSCGRRSWWQRADEN